MKYFLSPLIKLSQILAFGSLLLSNIAYSDESNLSGNFWQDTNQNGLRDREERKSTDIKSVLLLRIEGITNEEIFVGQITSDSDDYYFENLDQGNYRVVIETQEGCKLSPANVGDDDTMDSDFYSWQQWGWTSDLIVNGTGISHLDVDAGVICGVTATVANNDTFEFTAEENVNIDLTENDMPSEDVSSVYYLYGDIPVGLTLNDDGSLTGIPSAAGHYSFTYQLNSTSGSADKATVNITVNPSIQITPIGTDTCLNLWRHGHTILYATNNLEEAMAFSPPVSMKYQRGAGSDNPNAFATVDLEKDASWYYLSPGSSPRNPLSWLRTTTKEFTEDINWPPFVVNGVPVTSIYTGFFPNVRTSDSLYTWGLSFRPDIGIGLATGGRDKSIEITYKDGSTDTYQCNVSINNGPI